ncbi:Gfo/Idh/MocA family protein [Agarivorans sp. QJM3NY_25]|uniref:Gfo/Idh/MocA family protein n=1 Tax=Agarivorans sp. QJM3NY_25 TaxID=3421430 RepID=UPI003D7EC5B9
MKVAMIGLGDIAQKAYLPFITQLAKLDLVFCTRNTDTLKQLSKTFRVAEYCQDYRELPRFQVDAVMIHAATPAHAQIATFFLKQGIPTFVDKPLSDSAIEVEQLYELAAQKRLPLYLGFNRRHVPLFNQYIPELAQANIGSLQALRWEKNRHHLPGEIRSFIFDDFIHPLDSVNLAAKADLDDVYLTWQMQGEQLARIDVQWQTGACLFHASMNRQFGQTSERLTACYEDRAFEFDSFAEGKYWQNNIETKLMQKDWVPMLESKGFTAMVDDWLTVVAKGQLSSAIIERNIATHRLADRLCEKLSLKNCD